ncbi:MAG: methyltransferase domain-containing protein [Bdellovibrionales bacterium]|nr:methyltransferase domain-containing protein [Bdellovibrionales bacterium]
MLARNIEFFRGFLKEFHTTGAICSTSPVAAKTLCHPLEGSRSPKRILEVGAGTGAVTFQILPRLQEGDSLTICEVNSNFAEQLRKRLDASPLFAKHAARTSFFEGYIQELTASQPFDVIICSLPFLNFTVELTDEIFTKLRELSHEPTVLTYYEYIGIRSLSKIFSLSQRRERFQKLDAYLTSLLLKHEIQKERIWFNFLPIDVHTLQLLGKEEGL